MDEDFNRKLAGLDDEASAERSEIAAAHARHKKDMNDVIMAMQTQFTELEGDLRQVTHCHPECAADDEFHHLLRRK